MSKVAAPPASREITLTGRLASAVGTVLPPENVRRIGFDRGEENLDVRGGWGSVVAMELEVAIPPVQRPQPRSLGVPEAGDRQPGPLRTGLLPPRGAPLDDGQVARRDLAFHPYLASGVLWHAPLAPATDASDIKVRQASHEVQCPALATARQDVLFHRGERRLGRTPGEVSSLSRTD